ncbi:MAG: methyltetrahydrofolate cobalamin methyltransferase [Syntrophaceticus schinkii]|jgi:cobalamin-dependent methionine synthase I
MLVVGELINASRKAIAVAIEAQNEEEIKKVASDQVQAGADFVDVNAGVFVGKEADYLQWLVKTVQDEVDAPCCIDSPDPVAIEKALAVHKGTAMINSISLEKERYEALLPLVADTDLKIVALCMSDEGMPETCEERVKIADKLINSLVGKNVPIENIYVDPLVQPVSTNGDFGVEFLNAVEKIMTGFPGVHTMCGLSNISYGLPLRKHLNQNFAVMAIARGLDGLIINPLDKRMMANIIAAETLAGRDNYCMNYLKAYRDNKFEF